jgi:hypothetical protein
MDERPGSEPATVRITHFSVQEYLESGRISQQVAGFTEDSPDALEARLRRWALVRS